MLVTAAEARLQIPELSGTAEDTNLETLITRVGAAFARYCGYPGSSPTMESTSYARYYDGPGGRDLVLDVWPIVSISSIYDDTTLDFTDSQYLVSSSDYVVVNGRIVRLKNTSTHGAWSEGAGQIKVSFTAGYATVPDDLKQLVIMAVKHWFDLRRIQGKSNTSQGGVSVGFRDEEFLPAMVKAGLSPFRLPRAIL